jgi:hypothetical protein
LGDNKKIGLRG